MRKLLYFAMGMATACAMSVYGEGTLVRQGLTAVLLVFFASVGKEAGFVQKMLLLLMGCCFGLFWFFRYEEHYLSTAAALDAQTQTVQLRTTDFSYETTYGMACDGIVTLEGKPYLLRIYLDAGEPIGPGVRINGAFRFRATTADSAQEAIYHPGLGIFLLAYQSGELAMEPDEGSWRDYPARLRHRIQEILQSHFSPETAAFARALLLGDTSQLTYATDTDLKISGIRHVVAVSGLHISSLFALLSAMTFRKRWLMALLGFPLLLLFAAVAGFSPSVTRACLMSALMLAAMLAGKEYDGPTALSFAVVVMLLGNPLVITSVGFQLSVGSVAGIFLFTPGIQTWFAARLPGPKGRSMTTRLIRWFSSSVSVTLSAMILTTPLCAWYFGTVSLISVLTNLLTLWIISSIFYGLIAICVLSTLLPAAAGVLAWVVSVLIQFVLLTAKTLADFPLAAVYTISPYITAWLIFCYLLLARFLVSRNRKPVLLSGCAALGLCLALLASWAEPMLDAVRFTVLDVGQGQCLLLQWEGKHFLIDCGGDQDSEAADMAAETLLSQGINRLDALILTHLDRDHAGGVEGLLSRVDTDLLILPPENTELARCTDGQVLYAARDLELRDGNAVIRIFVPTFPGNRNEKSLCILFDGEKCDILITGDRSGFGEHSLLRNADIPDVDILVAGHHGAESSTCEELLAAARPETVCISVGRDNFYGHPSDALLQRLECFGCTVWRTDIHGTILIRRGTHGKESCSG